MYLKKKDLYSFKLDDMEKTIMSCILQKPEYMKDERLKDELFINHQKLWQFLKAIYKKFGCFDINLAYNMVQNKYSYVGMLNELLDIEPIPSNFDWYVKELIRIKEEQEKESVRINAIFNMAHDLVMRNMTTQEFKDKIDNMFKED